MGFNNPFLKELANTPFPAEIDTTIIAVKAVFANKKDPINSYASWLASRVGEGDFIVPVESAKVPVNHYHEVAEKFSPRAIHRFLPYNKNIQQIVIRSLIGLK